MGLLDLITGGANEKAQDDLANALAQIQGIQTPTADQLQLSPLAQYTNAGELEAALADSAQSGPSAFNNEAISSVPMSVIQQALAKEGQIADANGMTPQERAAIAEAEDAVNTNTAGQRGAIEQHYEQMGVPQSLIAAALENGTVGQNAQQGYLSALEAQGQAANQGLTALQNEGVLAGQEYGLQTGQANTIAAAQDALNKFNATNTQQTNLANQANKQATNAYNTENAQNIGNTNVSTANQRQIYNQTQAPVTAAQLALEKGQAEAGVGEAQAGQQTAAGQQAAGLFGSLVGAGATAGAGAFAKPAVINIGTGVASAGTPEPGNIPVTAADGGEIPEPMIPPINFKMGGSVPGVAQVDGDDPRNDTVPARLSPGEVVLPRTVVKNPANLGAFLKAKAPDMAQRMAAHPSDLAQVIRALSMLRQGAA